MENLKINYNTTNYWLAPQEGKKKYTTYPTLLSWKVHAEIVWKNSWWSFLLSLPTTDKILKSYKF